MFQSYNLYKEVINMKCPYCGAEIPDNSKFCPICGQAISQEPVKEEIEEVNSPAHEVNAYNGAFSQNISGPNKVTNINMSGGVNAVQPMTPEKLYKSSLSMAIVSLVFAIIGLIVSALGLKSGAKDLTMYFVIGAVGSFFPLFMFLIGFFNMQVKLMKAKKPSEGKDYIPLIMWIAVIGVTIPAVIMSVKVFLLMLN